MFKQQSKVFVVLSMAPIPQFRVNFTFPFFHTGVDYMGLLFVKNVFYNKDETLYKVFIVVYTCASSRAIQLNIVCDASCFFIHSLKRFISVNGVPDLYISDNVKCFTGWELKDYLFMLSTSRRYISKVPMVGRVLGTNISSCQEKSTKNFVEIKTDVLRTTRCL